MRHSIINKSIIFTLTILSLTPGQIPAGAADYQPVPGKIMTRWAQEVTPDNVWPEYPRPMMVRKEWLNLNGLWDYAIQPKDQDQPQKFDGKILVPFPVESALSGVKKAVGPDNRLWYQRTFDIPHQWTGKRVLIHFGAVDWDATVWVNGSQVGSHRGGYDPFSFDITDALKKSGPQKIVISVWDPTDKGYQPRGKQVLDPEGIWYTSVTGIWQTVWLEPVPEVSIKNIDITTDIDSGLVTLTAHGQGHNIQKSTPHNYRIIAVASQGQDKVSSVEGALDAPMQLKIENPNLWSPNSPFLYDLKITLNHNGYDIDTVVSYFGMRKIELKKDQAGVNRLFLNNQALFQYGPLDQGWWPDGLYLAPTDEALRYDIEVLKKLGCNMLRKHVKVEPQRFYYWCDKLGLLIWQDMPNGDKHIGPKNPDLVRSPDSVKQYKLELKRMIDAFGNHPCIVMWVPFNEGWGQFDTAAIVSWLKKHDPTRLVNNTSGWIDRGVGDVNDIHKYPGPGMAELEPHRAVVLGEFGGLGLPVKDHTWQDEKNWGYRSFKNSEELTTAYVNLINKLRPLIKKGLAAAVYTQTTDVEIEVNGLMTYDRVLIKMDIDQVRAANEKLYLPETEK